MGEGFKSAEVKKCFINRLEFYVNIFLILKGLGFLKISTFHCMQIIPQLKTIKFIILKKNNMTVKRRIFRQTFTTNK